MAGMRRCKKNCRGKRIAYFSINTNVRNNLNELPHHKEKMPADRKPTKETLDKWHNDPNNWKWGIFYFNKEDKRIFPPKRNKYFGWTVNFANPISILAIIVLIILMLVIPNYLTKL